MPQNPKRNYLSNHPPFSKRVKEVEKSMYWKIWEFISANGNKESVKVYKRSSNVSLFFVFRFHYNNIINCYYCLAIWLLLLLLLDVMIFHNITSLLCCK